MFDSQKLSFESFLLNYKHGVYVFVSDSCQVCVDYKLSIEHINNKNLYIVEVLTKDEKTALARLINRTAFPSTVAFKDNQIEFVRMGMLFETQLLEFFDFLKEIGDEPLSDEEIKKRLDKENRKCVLSYYIFPYDITDEARNEHMLKSIEYNEMPIDVDMFVKDMSYEDKLHMLDSNLFDINLVIFDDNNSSMNKYTKLGQKIIINYVAINREKKFIKRDV